MVCQSPRLMLRKIEDTDAESLFEILGDPDVMKFSVRGPDTREDIFKFIHATKKRYERDGVAQWGVILKASGELIGTGGISVQSIEGENEYEIGYRFKKRHWGQGYGSEAAIACRDYALGSLKLERLISIIEKDNVASIRVAKKVGMTLEKESVFHNIPVQVYSMDSTLNAAVTSSELVEGRDYTLEKGLMVFTKAYHIARGYCCDSGCRNCPY